MLVMTIFITSSDSGSLVVDQLAAGGLQDVPTLQRTFWALTEGAVSAVLLIGGGLTALQAASIATGIPFAVVLFLMCYAIYRGLDNEYKILESNAFTRQSEVTTEKDKDENVSSYDDIANITKKDKPISNDD
jgi:choline/glycine/proline betaine transport protein